jgi:hypothetical protein
MENKDLYVMFLKEGEKVIFESLYGFTKKGTIKRNYKNGEFLVEYDNGTKDEVIGAEQIIFSI